MTPRLLILPALAAAGMFLTSCASTGTQVNPAISSAVSSHGVDSGTAEKMADGQVLDYNDISNLVSKDVPSNVIVAYLTSTRKTYNFSYAQLQGLRSAGASAQVLNYLTESQGFYGNNTPKQISKAKNEQKGEYYNSPHYQDQAPFAYNQPEIDDWYDSGYTESLYSPFSFN